MNKNFRVITINGIRGIIVAIFIVMGLIAGFIVSPGWACMKMWNHFMQDSNIFAQMNLLQGIMMWAMIALSLYALNNKKAVIGFGSYPGLTPEQIRSVVARAKRDEKFLFKKLEKKIQEVKNAENQLQNNSNVDSVEKKSVLTNNTENLNNENVDNIVSTDEEVRK